MVGCGLNLAVLFGCDNDPEKISRCLQFLVHTWVMQKSKQTDKNGKNVLNEKMKLKINEIWPHGYEGQELDFDIDDLTPLPFSVSIKNPNH